MPIKNYFKKDNILKHKLFLRGLSAYVLLVIILSCLMVPIYFQTYNVVKNSVVSSAQSYIEQGVQLLQEEIDTYYAILDALTSNREFIRIKNLSGNTTSEDYFYMVTLQKYYSDLLLSSSIAENSFIMFSGNDVVLSKREIYENARSYYGKSWEYEGLTYDELTALFFEERYYGEFLPSIRFHEIMNNKFCDMTFIFTIPGRNVVLFSVYDSDKILKMLSLDEIAENGRVRILNNKGEESFKSDNFPSHAVVTPDIVYTSPNSRITVEVSISDSFYENRLAPIRKTLLFYAVLFFLFGIIFSIFLGYTRGKPLMNLMNYLLTNSEDPYAAGSEYDYIRNHIIKLSDERVLTNEQLLDKMFAKLLFVGLSQKEAAEFLKLSDGIPDECCLLMIKSYAVDWEEKFKTELEFLHIFPFKMIALDRLTNVMFIENDNISVDVIKAAIIQVNKESNFKIKGVLSMDCKLVSDTAGVFIKLREVIKYIEPGTLMTFDNIIPMNTQKDVISEYYAKSKSFYELLLCGDNSEANRKIYTQWYELSKTPTLNNGIANLFYYQTGVIMQVSLDVSFNEPLPIFNQDNDILANAVDVAQYVELLCDFIKGNRKEENTGQTIDVIDYININYRDPSFYLPVLSKKFNLSAKPLTRIVKNMTGMTFSVYLTHLRLKCAEELLKETDVAIQDVATQSGFESANSFFKNFKKEYGVSPTVFRNSRKYNAREH